MAKPATKKPTVTEKIKDKLGKQSQKKMLTELFNDWYLERRKVYRMNLVRGLAFGLGSAIGGTIGFAIVIAILALVLNLLGGFPLIGDWFDALNRDFPTDVVSAYLLY